MGEHPSFNQHILPPGEPVSGKTYRADGWAYIDPPVRFSPEIWDHFLALIGEGEFVILVGSSGNHPSDEKPFVRGQLLVSPAGMANLQAAARRAV